MRLYDYQTVADIFLRYSRGAQRYVGFLSWLCFADADCWAGKLWSNGYEYHWTLEQLVSDNSYLSVDIPLRFHLLDWQTVVQRSRRFNRTWPWRNQAAHLLEHSLHQDLSRHEGGRTNQVPFAWASSPFTAFTDRRRSLPQHISGPQLMEVAGTWCFPAGSL